MYAIRYARLTLGQTCKTCNPSVPIGTWGADPRISQLGGFVSPPPHIYTLYNCYNPPLPLPCAVLRAQRGGRGYSYQLAGVKCVSGVRSDFPVFFLAPGKPYRVHVILSTTTQIAFRKKTKTSLTLVGGESALRTLPCQGRGTCSGGPRGPPGGVLRVVI